MRGEEGGDKGREWRRDPDAPSRSQGLRAGEPIAHQFVSIEGSAVRASLSASPNATLMALSSLGFRQREQMYRRPPAGYRDPINVRNEGVEGFR
jgi:hypothetical protein